MSQLFNAIAKLAMLFYLASCVAPPQLPNLSIRSERVIQGGIPLPDDAESGGLIFIRCDGPEPLAHDPIVRVIWTGSDYLVEPDRHSSRAESCSKARSAVGVRRARFFQTILESHPPPMGEHVVWTNEFDGHHIRLMSEYDDGRWTLYLSESDAAFRYDLGGYTIDSMRTLKVDGFVVLEYVLIDCGNIPCVSKIVRIGALSPERPSVS